MRLSSLFLTATIGLCLIIGIVWLIKRQLRPSWSTSLKVAIYIGGWYFILASVLAVYAIRAGGEGQMIILIMGFPTVLLGVIFDPLIQLWGKPFEYLLVISLLLIHSALIGGIVWLAGNFYVGLIRKIPAWSRLSNSGKWGITSAIVHFLIIALVYSLLRRDAEVIIRVFDAPTIFITLPCETLHPPGSEIRFLFCHLLIGSFLYGMIGYFIREGAARLGGDTINS
jgi:hypothetical protein